MAARVIVRSPGSNEKAKLEAQIMNENKEFAMNNTYRGSPGETWEHRNETTKSH